MDAVKFLAEFNRMHHHYDINCRNCPRGKEGCSLLGIQDKVYFEKLVSDVEKWSKEHPVKTRQQDFLEKFPKAETDDNGMPNFCCAELGYTCDCLKTDCRECWNMPVEEDEK